ncbi:MAG: polysaccharide biosynthesis C-terminal domain-containing protein [Oscillospiraceae bacterium]|nr:polysaccharide biosynthesis C-terminal domain-containing protein [Oscillospiraceae bacterium]
MDKYQKLANNTIVLAIGQFGSKLLVYLMLGFYTSMLGTEGFGDVTNIINASALLISVVTLSISEGVLRYGLDKGNNRRHVLSIGINVALIGLVIFAAFVPLIGFIEMLKSYEWLIFMYVCTGSIKGICSIYVRACGHVKLYAVDGILTTVSNVLFNLLLLGVFKMGVLGYVLSVSLADLTSIVFLSLKAGLVKRYRPLGNDKLLRNSMLRYSIPLMPTAVMWWVVNVSDTFMVTAVHGSSANGVYSFAYKFPNLAAIVVGIFLQAWQMSAITERNSRTVSNFYSNVFSLMQTVMYVAVAGIMLILRPIIMPFFGGEGFEGAYFYVPCLLGAVVFQCSSNFMGSVYSASGKTTHSFVSSAIGAAVNIALNLILLHTIGVIGAAIATLVSYVVVFVYRAIDTKKILYMKMGIPKMAINLAVLSGMAVSVMFLPYGLFQNVFNCVLFMVIVAINFRSAVKAIKLFLSKRGGKEQSNISKEG